MQKEKNKENKEGKGKERRDQEQLNIAASVFIWGPTVPAWAPEQHSRGWTVLDLS